jgi:hypothetical protein
MKGLVKYLYHNTKIGYVVVSIPLYFYDFFRYKMFSDKTFIKRRYNKTFGYKLNLKKPQTFTEKMQWLKLYEHTDLLTICADKLAVRRYVREKIGGKYLLPLIYHTDKVKDIHFDEFPAIPVVIKVNHNSGGTIIVKDKNAVNFKKLRLELKIQLKSNYFYSSGEWQYKNIKPCILIEKLLQDDTGNDILNDYKIHCFNGKPQYIQTFFDRETEIKENWYDREWNPLDVYDKTPKKRQVPKPELLGDLLEIASILSKDFIYVRVDLYISQNQIYFGELTFHPASGFMKFQPQEFDRILGDKLKLPIEV